MPRTTEKTWLQKDVVIFDASFFRSPSIRLQRYWVYFHSLSQCWCGGEPHSRENASTWLDEVDSVRRIDVDWLNFSMDASSGYRMPYKSKNHIAWEVHGPLSRFPFNETFKMKRLPFRWNRFATMKCSFAKRTLAHGKAANTVLSAVGSQSKVRRIDVGLDES